MQMNEFLRMTYLTSGIRDHLLGPKRFHRVQPRSAPSR